MPSNVLPTAFNLQPKTRQSTKDGTLRLYEITRLSAILVELNYQIAGMIIAQNAIMKN